jgi:hypothetical protein
MNAFKSICVGFATAALGSLSSAVAQSISYLPAYPVPDQTIVLRVDDWFGQMWSRVGPHTASIDGQTIRVEGCISEAGRSVSGDYSISLNLSVQAGDYQVEYYRSVQAGLGSLDRQCQIDPGTSRLRGSTTLKVRPAGWDWPPPAGPVAAVYHYSHNVLDSSDGHFFMTVIEAEQVMLESGQLVGWQRIAPIPWRSSNFGFFMLPAPDRVPVCRFYTERFAPVVSHFYTADRHECEPLKQSSDWIYEGIVAYVWPARADGTCAQGKPLYRLFNNGRRGDGRTVAPSHRYTDDLDDRNLSVALGWTAEGYGKGVVMCVPPAP